MEIVRCPELDCGAPAEVLDTWTFGSRDGPLAHVKTRCLDGHCLTPRRDQVIPATLPTNVPVAHRLGRAA